MALQENVVNISVSGYSNFLILRTILVFMGCLFSGTEEEEVNTLTTSYFVS